jgi:hypothetical protein
MLVPLYGFVAGDTLGVLVLVHDHETIGELARRAQQAATVRVAPKRTARVIVRGHAVDHHLTVGAAGLGALDRVDIIGEDP